MMFNNQAVARVLGAPEWSDLLAIYQFMARADDQWENEWRIVNQLPDYSIGKTSAAAIPQVCPPQGWATVMNVIKPPPEAVLHLVAPKENVADLRAALPEPFKQIGIDAEA